MLAKFICDEVTRCANGQVNVKLIPDSSAPETLALAMKMGTAEETEPATGALNWSFVKGTELDVFTEGHVYLFTIEESK